jgi:hypothetical protein
MAVKLGSTVEPKSAKPKAEPKKGKKKTVKEK